MQNMIRGLERRVGTLGRRGRSTRPDGLALALLITLFVFGSACSGDDADSAGDPPAASSVTPTQNASPDPGRAFKGLEFPADLVDGQAIGKPVAPLTLTAFEDFQCPFCLRFTLLNEPVIVEEYVLTGKVRFEFKHLPILGNESRTAAIAATCASDQGLFWALHERLFLVQLDAGQLTAEKLNAGRFSIEKLQQYAAEAGLDAAAFNTCLMSPAAADRVTAQLREASALGLRGTPSFLVNGEPVTRPPTTPGEWRSFLDEQIKAAR